MEAYGKRLTDVLWVDTRQTNIEEESYNFWELEPSGSLPKIQFLIAVRAVCFGN